MKLWVESVDAAQHVLARVLLFPDKFRLLETLRPMDRLDRVICGVDARSQRYHMESGSVCYVSSFVYAENALFFCFARVSKEIDNMPEGKWICVVIEERMRMALCFHIYSYHPR